MGEGWNKKVVGGKFSKAYKQMECLLGLDSRCFGTMSSSSGKDVRVMLRPHIIILFPNINAIFSSCYVKNHLSNKMCFCFDFCFVVTKQLLSLINLIGTWQRSITSMLQNSLWKQVDKSEHVWLVVSATFVKQFLLADASSFIGGGGQKYYWMERKFLSKILKCFYALWCRIIAWNFCVYRGTPSLKKFCRNLEDHVLEEQESRPPFPPLVCHWPLTPPSVCYWLFSSLLL